MIVCTVILALLAVLIATEGDPQEAAAPDPEQNPPQDAASPARTPRRLHAPTDSDRTMNTFAGKFRFDRQCRISRASLPFPSTRT